MSLDERSDEDRQRFLCSPDILLSICSVLRRNRDVAPAVVLREAADIYQWISRPGCDLGLFDERDYFLGEIALVAGGVSRQLGKREEAFLWLDRAEAGFRHTMNPAPGLANVAYARLALRFEMGRYQDVLELLPALETSFLKIRMEVEATKCRLLLAMTLKQTGENEKALDVLGTLHQRETLRSEPGLCARILAELGDVQQLRGDPESAMGSFQAALGLLAGDRASASRADLKLYVGNLCNALGRPGQAEEAFRAAQQDYLAMEMEGFVAYMHLLIAETLLAMQREREAEWEVLSALPTIEKMKMVPEGVAAVALLRESVRLRKTDRAALEELRRHLQANN